MAASGAQKCPKSEKLDEAQALAKSCAGRPDFLPCDGLSICATHSHGKCFKLHWCCHLGWCHCKFPTRSFYTAANVFRYVFVGGCFQLCVEDLASPCCSRSKSRNVRLKGFLCPPTFRTCLDLLPQVVVFHSLTGNLVRSL